MQNTRWVYWILDHLHKVLTAKSRKTYLCHPHLEVSLKGDGQRAHVGDLNSWGPEGPNICQPAASAATPSLRIQGPGLFFELPKIGSQGKGELVSKDLSGHSRYCLILHEETKSQRSTRFCLMFLKISAQI